MTGTFSTSNGLSGGDRDNQRVRRVEKCETVTETFC